MQLKIITEPFNHIIVEETFDQQSYGLIWDELQFLQPRMLPPSSTASSRDSYGNPEKKGSGIFLDDFFKSPQHSDIYKNTRKFFAPHVINSICQTDHFYNIYKKITFETILTQCYRNGDYYLPHFDNFIFTIVTVLHNTPKKFSGGEFLFPSFNYEAPLKNNCSIIFPSSLFHQVNEIKLNSNDPRDFRYTISMFLDIKTPQT